MSQFPPCRNGHGSAFRFRTARGVLRCSVCVRVAATKTSRAQGKRPALADTRGMSVSAKIGFYTGPREPNGCRLWTGVISRGYAAVHVNQNPVRVGRLILGLQRGGGDGLVARHKCDNKKCVEPSHLERGTTKDNVADAIARGQHPCGEGHPTSKLTSAHVEEMRRLRAEGATIASLARRYGVADTTAGKAVRGLTWKRACRNASRAARGAR